MGVKLAELDALIGRVASVALRGLHAWPENPRVIRPERLEQLKRALVEDPAMLWARPLLVLPDGAVVCGNQRLLAAIELGWETIPAIRVDLDRERARLWALRDNNAYGDWDEPALAELLAELAADGVELSLAGFADQDLDRILGRLALTVDPDAAPPLPAGEPNSRPGEIYELGEHWLLCGDATDEDAVRRLLGAQRPELLWTDPPYGVGYIGKTERGLRIRNDDAAAGLLLERALATAEPLLAQSARFYIASPSGRQGTVFRNAIAAVGWQHHQTLVWVKNSLVLGHSDYHLRHEDVLYGWKPGEGRPGRGRHAGSRWYGGNAGSSVFFHDRPSRSETHPTMKPVALIAEHLSNSTLRGDAVLDLFAGSGSTLIACEQLGRPCFAVELDPGYCDVIRERYWNFHDGCQ